VDPVPDPQLLRKSGSAENRTRDLWVNSQELWALDHRGGQTLHKRHINVSAKWESLLIKYELRVVFLFRHSVCISPPLFRVRTNFTVIPGISLVCSQLRETAVWFIVSTVSFYCTRCVKWTSFACDHADQIKLFLRYDTHGNSIQVAFPWAREYLLEQHLHVIDAWKCCKLWSGTENNEMWTSFSSPRCFRTFGWAMIVKWVWLLGNLKNGRVSIPSTGRIFPTVHPAT
jgi:hypothetical protein